ncbi:MAG: hypothetical protein COA69_07600 [Robiginitomaculum sp.]|nr:MAG: hypothetical protein COA69_07600 [Robiginitomaculum sp.]
MRHGNVFIISLGLLTLLLWTFAIGLERALAVWAVQIMASGVILSTSFALLDARKSSDTK